MAKRDRIENGPAPASRRSATSGAKHSGNPRPSAAELLAELTSLRAEDRRYAAELEALIARPDAQYAAQNAEIDAVLSRLSKSRITA